MTDKDYKKKRVVKWRNKFSGEEGYVQSVSVAKGYFTATNNYIEAKAYRSEADVKRDFEILDSFGEWNQNDFFVDTVFVPRNK